MELEKQCCNLQQAKRLKELGVKQESLFYFEWNQDKRLHNLRYVNSPSYMVEERDYSAFTTAELGAMLPKEINFNKTQKAVIEFSKYGVFFGVSYRRNSSAQTLFCKDEKIEAHARAAMLIHLLESSLITPQQVNLP